MRTVTLVILRMKVENFGDPAARNRWFIFILAFVKQHFIELILCNFSIYIM